MSGGGAGFGPMPVTGSELIQFIPLRPAGGAASDVSLFTTAQDIANLAFNSDTTDTPFIDVTKPPYNAVADGQKTILLVTQPVGETTFSVSMPSFWGPGRAYSTGSVRINGTGTYLCVTAGISGSGGPTGGTAQGAQIPDGTVGWAYLGTAATTANIFAPTDTNKILTVMRADAPYGASPWYSNAASVPAAGPDIGHTYITGYNSSTSVNVSYTASVQPTDPLQAINQSWPYSAIPCYVMWGTDNSTPFQEALDVGGNIFIPNGNYCFGTQLVCYSNVSLFSFSQDAVLMPCGVISAPGPAWQQTSSVKAFFVPSAYTIVSFKTPQPANSAPALRAQYADKNIFLTNFTIDMSITSLYYGNVISRFMFSENVHLDGMKFLGNPLWGFEGPNFVGASNFSVTNCDMINVGYAHEPWWGPEEGKFSYNRCVVPYNITPGWFYNLHPGLQGYNGPQINVLGYADEAGSGYQILHNDIYLNGGVDDSFTGAAFGIVFFTDGGSSVFSNMEIVGNNIFCTGVNNCAISVNGGGKNFIINDNTIVGSDGRTQAPLTVQGNGWNKNTNLVTLTPTSGSSTISLNWPGFGYSGANNSVVEAYALLIPTSGSLTVGGNLITGYYPILSVSDANDFVIQTYKTASDSVPVSWPGGFVQITNFPQSYRIENNHFIDCYLSWGITFITQTANFTVGATLTGGSSGATGTITSVEQYSGSGALTLSNVVGAFVGGEIITDNSGGSATSQYYTLPPPLINTQGVDIQVIGNDSYLTNVSSSTIGTYQSIVSFAGVQNRRGGIASNNTGHTGIGPTKTGGNNRVGFIAGLSPPIINDTDDINNIVNPSRFSGLDVYTFYDTVSPQYAIRWATNGGGLPYSYFGASLGYNWRSGGSAVDLWNWNAQAGTGFEFHSLQSASVAITIASPSVVSLVSHGFTTGKPVAFSTTIALPTGITAGTTYYVSSSGLTTNSFEFSTASGTVAVNTTGTQSGTQYVLWETRPLGLWTTSAVFNGAIIQPANYGLTATGTTSASALVLTARYNEIVSGAGLGVSLYPPSVPGPVAPTPPAYSQTVYNSTSGAIEVYPPSGMQIDWNGTNVAVSLAKSTSATYDIVYASQVYTQATTGTASGAGSVTSVTGGQGIAGGAITTTGTLYLSSSVLASASANQVTFGGTGLTTSVAFSPSGTGSFTLVAADSTAFGGNARGRNAVDLQGPNQRTLPAQVASGTNSFVAGFGNTASNTASIALGNDNLVSGQNGIAAGTLNTVAAYGGGAFGNVNTVYGNYSFAFGSGAYDRQSISKFVYAAGQIAQAGDAQTSTQVLRGISVNGTASVRLTTDGNAAGAFNSIPLATSCSYSYWGYMVANQAGTASKQWSFSGLIRQGTASATTTLVGSTASSSFGDAGLSTIIFAQAADTSNGAISLSVTGVTATTIHYLATVFTSEVI